MELSIHKQRKALKLSIQQYVASDRPRELVKIVYGKCKIKRNAVLTEGSAKKNDSKMPMLCNTKDYYANEALKND